jgi:hypothetical protein
MDRILAIAIAMLRDHTLFDPELRVRGQDVRKKVSA